MAARFGRDIVERSMTLVGPSCDKPCCDAVIYLLLEGGAAWRLGPLAQARASAVHGSVYPLSIVHLSVALLYLEGEVKSMWVCMSFYNNIKVLLN